MKNLSNFRPAHWLIFTLANLLIFSSCSKSDNNDTPEAPSTVQTPEHLTDWKPQPKVDVAQPYMAFATGSASATTLSLTAVGSTATATDVWVDTNNNGIFDEGVDKRITDFTKPITFTAASGVFIVYGKVKELTATGNALTAADVRSNAALTKLNVAGNQLSEKALLNLVNSLPATTASGTTAVVLRKDTDERNTVTEAVRIAAKQRGWQALKVEGGKEVPDLPADTQAPKAGAITEATATAFNSVLVKWNAATDNKTAAEKLRYQVLYEVKGSGEVKTSALKENMLNFTLTGLTEKTTYIIKVKVLDEAGNATDYEAKEVTTPAAPEEKDKEAPKVGTITKVESSMLNTILVEWTPATDNKTAAEKLRYQVVYQVKGSMIVKTTELTENKLSYTLTYLNKNTTYIIKVRVLDEAGNSAEYEAKEVTVFSIDFSDKEAPKVGTITKAKASAANTIFLEWTAATDNKTPQEKLRYQVVYNIKGSGDEKTTELTENKLSHALFFLKKNKTYVIKVRVMDEDGNTAEYAPKEVTVGKIPGPNGDLDVSRFMILTTDKPIGDTIEIRVDADDKDEKGVWIDFNNNGQWDDGIDVIPETFGAEAFYTIKSKKFTVYGNIYGFYTARSLISDVKLYNPGLVILRIENSNLTSLTLPSPNGLAILTVSGDLLTSLQIGDAPDLQELDVDETGLTSLDISAYPKLKELDVDGLALSSLDASKNPLLKLVYIRRYDGKGLIGKPLEDFVKSLPAGKGKIYLSNDQKTPIIKAILDVKGWEIK